MVHKINIYYSKGGNALGLDHAVVPEYDQIHCRFMSLIKFLQALFHNVAEIIKGLDLFIETIIIFSIWV